MESLILVIALGCMAAFVIMAMMMVHEVSKRGVKINIPLLRLLVIRYVEQYKQITKEETGKVGPLFYPCITSIIIALVLVLVYVLI